jgi:hypothetical protein
MLVNSICSTERHRGIVARSSEPASFARRLEISKKEQGAAAESAKFKLPTSSPIAGSECDIFI